MSIPLNDTQDYHLIVDKDDILTKVQVKSSSCKTKYGNYQGVLKNCGGTKGIEYKTVMDTNIDEVCILLGNLEMYIIPIGDINNRSTINICEKYKNIK